GPVAFAATLGFDRAGTALDLLSLPPRARDLALIAIKEWKRRAEKKSQRVAGSGYSLLPAVFRADHVIDFPLSDLQTQFGDRARLIADCRPVGGPARESRPPQLFERERKRLAAHFADHVEQVRRRGAPHQQLQPLFRDPQARMRLNHGVVELEFGQLRPHEFDLRQIAYAHALLTDLHDPA